MGVEVIVNIREYGMIASLEKEVDASTLSFANGLMWIGQIAYRILIHGDQRNIPIGYSERFDDGFPRIICEWEGKETTDFFLDDVTLIPVRQNRESAEKVESRKVYTLQFERMTKTVSLSAPIQPKQPLCVELNHLLYPVWFIVDSVDEDKGIIQVRPLTLQKSNHAVEVALEIAGIGD